MNESLRQKIINKHVDILNVLVDRELAGEDPKWIAGMARHHARKLYAALGTNPINPRDYRSLTEEALALVVNKSHTWTSDDESRKNLADRLSQLVLKE